MKVLFTGSSSFTGYYFLKEINKNKIKTFAVFSREKKEYKKIFQKEILNSKMRYIVPCKKVNFGSKKYIDIIKKENINVICFHHFIVGNLNNKYDFNKNLKKLLQNIEEVIFQLSLNKNSSIIYTSSVYQKISSSRKYLNDKSRINYGYTKLILSQILKYMCKKYKIKFINFELQNPIGKFEKENSLPFYIASSFFNKNKIKLENPRRIFKYQFIENISKDYVKALINKKNLKSRYKTNSVEGFKEILLNQFKDKEINKKKKFFWTDYYKYYEKLNGLY